MFSHPDSDLIDRVGTTTEVAALFRVKSQAVSQWKKNGIPAARRQTLELLRPELFGAEGAPEIPTEEASDAA